MKQRDEDLAREVEVLKQRLEALEKQIKERGHIGIFNFHGTHPPAQ